jgi:hypothetical protein
MNNWDERIFCFRLPFSPRLTANCIAGIRQQFNHARTLRKNAGRGHPENTVAALKGFSKANMSKHGGEGGIRTHGTVSRTLAFEASTFNHSVTSPQWLAICILADIHKRTPLAPAECSRIPTRWGHKFSPLCLPRMEKLSSGLTRLATMSLGFF